MDQDLAENTVQLATLVANDPFFIFQNQEMFIYK